MTFKMRGRGRPSLLAVHPGADTCWAARLEPLVFSQKEGRFGTGRYRVLRVPGARPPASACVRLRDLSVVADDEGLQGHLHSDMVQRAHPATYGGR